MWLGVMEHKFNTNHTNLYKHSIATFCILTSLCYRQKRVTVRHNFLFQKCIVNILYIFSKQHLVLYLHNTNSDIVMNYNHSVFAFLDCFLLLHVHCIGHTCMLASIFAVFFNSSFLLFWLSIFSMVILHFLISNGGCMFMYLNVSLQKLEPHAQNTRTVSTFICTCWHPHCQIKLLWGNYIPFSFKIKHGLPF